MSCELQEESGHSEKCCRGHTNHVNYIKIYVCVKGKLQKQNILFQCETMCDALKVNI